MVENTTVTIATMKLPDSQAVSGGICASDLFYIVWSRCSGFKLQSLWMLSVKALIIESDHPVIKDEDVTLNIRPYETSKKSIISNRM